MTKRKPKDGPYSELAWNLCRLRRIANELEHGRALPHEDSKFLIDALWRIGEGENAAEILGVKAKRGERKSSEAAAATERRHFLLPLMTSLMQPIADGGQGLTLDEAADLAAEGMELEPETLKKYWQEYPELRGPAFPPPISSLPFRDKRVKARREPK